VIRRERVPNASFVATVQRDGFGELVAGGGISLGIPLPSPLGRTAKAEIAASVAAGRRARGEREIVRRRLALEATTATAELAASRETLALYEPEITRSALTTLEALAGALAAGQLELRDALLAQQSLLELLAGQLEAEHRVCIAAVALAHANGANLGGAP
jgi:outer membrane protein, heavy metal efflux system